MKKRNLVKKGLLFVMVSITAFTACKKSKEAIVPDCSISMKNIAGSYRITSVKYKATATATEQDYMQYQNNCEKDDVLELKENGSFNYKDMGIICLPNNSSTGTWNVTGTIITSSDADIISGTISSFDCKNLVYYVTNVITPTDKMVFTLTRQ
jgi:hypothetical protein